MTTTTRHQVTEFHPNGVIAAIYSLNENGQREGTYTAYYSNGQELFHTDDWQGYFENGNDTYLQR